MPLTIAVQADALASLNPATDSTVLLMEEAHRRGHALFHYTPDRLACENGVVRAYAQPVEMRPGADPYYAVGAPVQLALAEADAVLMRQDPPFDMRYITACHLLERVHPETLVVNDPAFVRTYPEKLLPLLFPEYMPPTLISEDAAQVAAFHAAQGDIIIKPLYGYGSRSVVRLARGETDARASAQRMIAQERAPIIAQEFIPAIAAGDCRVTMIEGRIAAVLTRVPAKGDIRAAARLGATVHPVELNARQRAAAEAVGAFLAKHGVIFAGVDLIGDFLIEVNITSPTLLRQSNALYGLHLERDYWDAVERRL